jgi:hypothetical protein
MTSANAAIAIVRRDRKTLVFQRKEHQRTAAAIHAERRE